jgi:hypothetical protein
MAPGGATPLLGAPLGAPLAAPAITTLLKEALPSAKGNIGGGEGLPGTGNGPPAEPASLGLAAADLRGGLAPALLRVAAKSSVLSPDFTELAEAALPNCAGSDGAGF